MTAPTTVPVDAAAPVDEPSAAQDVEVVEQDLLVEDVSIDGMSGVY